VSYSAEFRVNERASSAAWLPIWINDGAISAAPPSPSAFDAKTPMVPPRWSCQGARLKPWKTMDLPPLSGAPFGLRV
jgi:hypothetical protein